MFWALVLTFLVSTCAAVVGTVVVVRRHDSRSVMVAAVAIAPGSFLLVETAFRLTQRWLGSRIPEPYGFVGTLPTVLWMFVGPFLFGIALRLRIKEDGPFAVTALLFCQLVSWVSATLVALWFASTV